VKRRGSLIATVVALFGLQAPLCALACLESPDAERVAAHQTEHPCHEQAEQPADSSTSGAPSTHEDCGCDLSYQALVSRADLSSSAVSLVLHRPDAQRLSTASQVHETLAVSRLPDLPPPDILLLKSILII
jgi:hypothetical protein